MIQKQNISFLPYIVISLITVLFLGGCAGSVKNMQAVPASSVNIVPKKGKSMIVFLRPSSFGFGIQSSVFEIKENTPRLVGITKRHQVYYIHIAKQNLLRSCNTKDGRMESTILT